MSQVCELQAGRLLDVSGVKESHTYLRSLIGGRVCNYSHTRRVQKHLDVDDDNDHDARW